VVGSGERQGEEDGLVVEKNADKANKIAEKLAEGVQTYYEAAVESTAAVQESNTRLAQNLFESGVEALRIQAELRDQTLQSLREQLRKHQEVFQEVSRESLGAYEGFIGSLFSYYREVLGEGDDSDG
jgi:hypothetical protein